MIERAQAKLTGLSNSELFRFLVVVLHNTYCLLQDRVAALPLPPNNETPAAIAPIKAMENASTAVMPRRVPPDGKTIREHTTDVQMSEELSTSETHVRFTTTKILLLYSSEILGGRFCLRSMDDRSLAGGRYEVDRCQSWNIRAGPAPTPRTYGA